MDHDQLSKIQELLQGFSTAMLVTHDGQTLRARPMAIAEVEPSCRVWFISSDETAKVHEIEKDTRVLVVCQKGESSHLSLNGVAHLEKDRARLERVWKESYKVWFPEGKSDPRIVLIGVDPFDAEYWDAGGVNLIKYLFQSAKAYLSGERPEIREGDQHGRMVAMQ